MNKSRRPLILLLSLTFALGYVIWSASTQFSAAHSVFQELREHKRKHIINYARLGRTLMQNGQVGELETFLQEAVEANYLDTYLLHHNGKVVLSRNVEVQAIGPDWRPEHLNQMLQFSDETVFSADFGDFILTLGVNHSRRELANLVLVSMGPSFLFDMIIVLVLFTGIAAFFHRDIRAILEQLQGRNRRQFLKVRTQSRESELLARGLAGYESSVQDLADENDTLRTQVLSAVQAELLSGRKPPYRFDCALVRCDVNRFSSLLDQYGDEIIIPIVNDFLKEASYVAARYGGFLYEYIGDEVLFYFKSDHHTCAAAVAVSAVRDLNRIAERFDERTRSEMGFPFTVKSALCRGELRFGRQVFNYSFSGVALIESVRILSVIEEKDANTLYFDQTAANETAFLCESESVGRVQLKGLKGERDLAKYLGHRSLEHWLSPGQELRNLSYYRSDEDLIRILQWLQTEAVSVAVDRFMGLMRIWRGFVVPNSSQALMDTYLNLLCGLLDRAAIHSDEGQKESLHRLLASLITVSQNLISRDRYNESLHAIFERALQVEDRRVVANTLDALVHFDPEGGRHAIHHIRHHEDNRILGNALVKEGTAGLEPPVVRRLKQMLQSSNPLMRASALYAVGELARHYRQLDRVYLNTHESFRQLLVDLPEHARSEHEPVCRQAVIAIQKLEDPEILARLQGIHRESPGPWLDQEMARIHAPPKRLAS